MAHFVYCNVFRISFYKKLKSTYHKIKYTQSSFQCVNKKNHYCYSIKKIKELNKLKFNFECLSSLCLRLERAMYMAC